MVILVNYNVFISLPLLQNEHCHFLQTINLYLCLAMYFFFFALTFKNTTSLGKFVKIYNSLRGFVNSIQTTEWFFGGQHGSVLLVSSHLKRSPWLLKQLYPLVAYFYIIHSSVWTCPVPFGIVSFSKADRSLRHLRDYRLFSLLFLSCL